MTSVITIVVLVGSVEVHRKDHRDCSTTAVGGYVYIQLDSVCNIEGQRTQSGQQWLSWRMWQCSQELEVDLYKYIRKKYYTLSTYICTYNTK